MVEYSTAVRGLRTALHENQRTILALTVLLLGGIALYPLVTPDTTSSDLGAFNRADVMFMGMMIIHHDQAIAMAELAPNRTDNENIRALAQNISAAQTAENKQMAEWLKSLGYDRPTRGHRMAGMATTEQMQQLKNSTGQTFDQLFAELMIQHHRGGINMAQTFSAEGKHSELLELEQDMITAQQNEIALMQQWQKNWE